MRKIREFTIIKTFIFFDIGDDFGKYKLPQEKYPDFFFLAF